jgi:hypothetical protein
VDSLQNAEYRKINPDAAGGMRGNRSAAEMKSKSVRSSAEAEFEKLLDILTRTGKYLEGLGIEASTLSSYKHLLRYLRARPESELLEIVGRSGSSRRDLRETLELSEDEIRSMSFERIMDLASNTEIPRRTIEKIATIRFGMTRGGLSTLRSRDALVEKLHTLIGNEGTHDAISRVASLGSSSQRGE